MIEDSRTANWERACQLHELLGVLATLIERHGPETAAHENECVLVSYIPLARLSRAPHF